MESKIERLKVIKNEMKNLLDEALDLVSDIDKREFRKATFYWYGHINTAIASDPEFVGNVFYTLEDTINSLETNEDENL